MNAPKPTGLRWVLMETAPLDHRLRLPGHHLAQWLTAREEKVAYLSPPVSPWHFLKAGRREDARTRWNQEGARGRWRGANLFGYIPRTLWPIHRGGIFDNNLAWGAAAALTFPGATRVMSDAGFYRPDVLLAQNFLLPGLISGLKPRALVVSIEDDLDGFPEMPRVVLRRMGEIVRRADLVTVTAENLREWAEKRGAQRVELLRNGVAVSKFRRPAGGAGALGAAPADWQSAAGDSGPVAVYMGALDVWFEEELLAAVAALLPHWRFVLIGQPRCAFAKLRACGNVHWLRARPQEELPPLLWRATAGMIPFKRSRLIDAVCPLKLFEYLAAGLPVVATDWPELRTLASPARLASSAADFAAALEAAAAEGEPARQGRVAWASRFDWDTLFTEFRARVADIVAARPFRLEGD